MYHIVILLFTATIFFPEGFSCVPTKFDTALLENPNKADLVQTVEACELKESCYRVPYLEYYYETVDDADGVRDERLKVGRKIHFHFLRLFKLYTSFVKTIYHHTSIATISSDSKLGVIGLI